MTVEDDEHGDVDAAASGGWMGGWGWVDVECSQVIDQIYATHITMALDQAQTGTYSENL